MNSRLMAGPWITDVERKIVADALTKESWYEKRYYYVEKFAKYLLTYLPDEVLRKGYEVARHRQESPAIFDEKHKFKLIPPISL